MIVGHDLMQMTGSMQVLGGFDYGVCRGLGTTGDLRARPGVSRLATATSFGFLVEWTPHALAFY
jgi:hypothetical protein